MFSIDKYTNKKLSDNILIAILILMDNIFDTIIALFVSIIALFDTIIAIFDTIIALFVFVLTRY